MFSVLFWGFCFVGFFCYHGVFKKGVKSVGTAFIYTSHSKPSDLKARSYLQSSLAIWNSITSKFKWQTAERAKELYNPTNEIIIVEYS